MLAAYEWYGASSIHLVLPATTGESSIEVHARPIDVTLVSRASQVAVAEIASDAKALGEERVVTVTTAADPSLANTAGGVIVWAQGGRIKCNNTLEARLNLVTSDLTPVIRDALFPSARS